jgi:hypothetical protein
VARSRIKESGHGWLARPASPSFLAVLLRELSGGRGRGAGGGGRRCCCFWWQCGGGGHELEEGRRRRRGWRGQEVGAAALRRELLPWPALHQQVLNHLLLHGIRPAPKCSYILECIMWGEDLWICGQLASAIRGREVGRLVGSYCLAQLLSSIAALHLHEFHESVANSWIGRAQSWLQASRIHYVQKKNFKNSDPAALLCWLVR